MIEALKVSHTITIVMNLNVFLFPERQNNPLASPWGIEVYRKSHQSFEVLLSDWFLAMFVSERADNQKN